MEGNSQDDGTDEALKEYYARQKEKRKKYDERKGGKKSVLGEDKNADKDGQDMHEGNTHDHTKLFTLTSAGEDKHTSSNSEEIPSSPLHTSRLVLQTIESNSDEEDILQDFNYYTSSEASPGPPGQEAHDEDVAMEGVDPPSEVTERTTAPDEATSGDQIQPLEGTTLLAPSQEATLPAPQQENNSLALLQENTSILTVDVVNDIVKGGRSTSPIREHTSDLEFFNIKEQRYHQNIQKFRNVDGSYTVSHPVAMSLFLALETEQRNKNYIYAQNEYQMTHMRNIMESANFAVQIRDEVSASITKHIIDKLSSPVADSKMQIELYTETLLQRLKDHEAQLDHQKNHRLERGFLSSTREEHAAEVLTHRITVLKEDNDELRAERDELTKANQGARSLVIKLKEEKISWQEKYLELLKTKRPRDEEPDSGNAKRRPDAKSPTISSDTTSNTLEERSSNTLPASSSSSRNKLRNDTSSTSRAASHRNTLSSNSAHSDRGRSNSTIIDHEHLSRVVEMNEQGKRAVRADLGLDFDPWDPNLTRWQQRLVMLGLWKREVRKCQRYVPDYSDDKAAGHRISHDGNIRIGVRATKDFVRISNSWSYEEGVNDLHDEYHKYHLRNYIPRVVGEYKKILNSPKMAAYTRCIPVDCYYEEILKDTPGFKHQALPRFRARSKSPSRRTERATQNTLSGTSRNNSSSSELNTLYTWANETIGECKVRRYRMDLLSLDEISEVERLAELTKSIRAGNPPGYYAAMRDAEVRGASLYFSAAVKNRLGNRKPYQGLTHTWAEGIHFTDFSAETLGSEYDAHQINLISARIYRITATAVEKDDGNISDGPGGQGTP